MALYRRNRWHLLGAALFSINRVSASFMEQSFMFDYAISTQPVQVPVTTQCETISIGWDRSSATGPSPTAPYYLQIYTSAFVFPFVVAAGSGLSFDWQVPFAPGTLYQICMFDKNGYTGGCQATYSMVADTTGTATCSNVTFPLGPLDVDAQVTDGPLSQYGWINSCSDIAITPKNGTPPYTLTVAPASHPPYNLTFDSQRTVNWTVDLSWASPFFISVVDSEFNFWSYGPLHSGNGATKCLSGTSLDSQSDAGFSSSSVLAGTGVAGLVVGMLAGIGSAVCFLKRRQKRRQRDSAHYGLLAPSHSVDAGLDPFTPRMDPYDTRLSLTSGSRYRPVPSMPADTSFSGLPLAQRASSYEVEPFVMPGEEQNVQGPLSPGSMNENGTRQQSGHVYVVHHDGGRAPITVYHDDGTEVVELPPRYNDDESSQQREPSEASTRSASDVPSSSDRDFRDGGRQSSDTGRVASTFLNEPRRPSRAPKKPGLR